MSDEDGSQFYPISALPALAAHIRRWLPEALEAERLYCSARPHCVDKAIVAQTLKLYRKTQNDVARFEAQLGRWRMSPLSLAARAKVDRLTMQLARIRKAVENVLTVAERVLRDVNAPSLSLKRDPVVPASDAPHQSRARTLKMVEEQTPSPSVPRKTYGGTRIRGAGSVVAVTTCSENGTTSSRLLDPRHDICNHSPDFEWGGGGSGSAQLALAILADYLEDPDLAVVLHQSFKVMVVALLPHEGWTLSDDDIAEAILHLGH